MSRLTPTCISTGYARRTTTRSCSRRPRPFVSRDSTLTNRCPPSTHPKEAVQDGLLGAHSSTALTREGVGHVRAGLR